MLQLGLFELDAAPATERGARARAGQDTSTRPTGTGDAPMGGDVGAPLEVAHPHDQTGAHRERSRPSVPAAPPLVQQTAPKSGRPAAPAVEFVRHPSARRYLIRVRVDGTVRVTIPRRGSKREAAAFYEQQQEWIARQQERVAELRTRLPADLPAEEQRALRARARRELPARLHELAAAVGLHVRRVSVRDQKQRWGSCSTSGRICLNWRLVTMPDWVRDYVIYHELMHLRRMDHSPAFWALVAAVCPRYQEARRWLRRHAHAPHAADGR